MYKKILLILVCTFILASLTSCELIEKVVEDDLNNFEVDTYLVYSDPDIDMFLTVKASGWTYSKKENSKVIMFYKERGDAYNSFAFNSNIMSQYTGEDEIVLRYIEQEWGISLEQLGTFIDDLTWDEMDDIQVGDYMAKRVHFAGNDMNFSKEAEGDYFFWWIDNRLYTCAFISYKKEYEETFDILSESLLTFRQ